MADVKHIRLFLSSPGDVAEERKIILSLIEQIHYDPSFRGKVWIDVIAWDKPGADTPMIATMTPQEAINEGLAKPSDCDIVIVIFWARMGTPLAEEEVKPEAHRFTDPGGLPDTRYLSGTEWEFIDAFEGSLDDGLPMVVVYRRNEKVLLDDEAPDYEEKLTQKRRVRAFFDNFKNADGSIRQGYNEYLQPEDFRQKFDTHLRKLLLTLLESPKALKSETLNKAAAKPHWHGSPFPGLRAFTPHDQPIFFGRGRETTELINRLRDSQFVAVVGASGAGKSSLVGAGLIPSLKANAIDGSKDWDVPGWDPDAKRWTGLRLTPAELSDNPFVALAAQLAPRCGLNPREVADHLLAEPETVGGYCEQLLAGKPIWAEVLLYIDQFEELFTVVKPDYREPFVKLIAAATEATRIRVIITLRADFVHRLVEHPTLNVLYNAGQYSVTIPRVGVLYEMIQKPAERAGMNFETGLVQTIIDETGTEPGALALMAYLLDELYHACKDKQHITQADYAAVGGVQGAIGKRAEETFSRLPGEDADKNHLLERVFHELVEVDERGVATRQRITMNPQELPEAVHALIRAFVDARLLTTDQLADHATLEVAHEALLRSWQRLAEWIEKTQDDLRTISRIKREARIWDDKGQPEHLRPNAETLHEFTTAYKRLGVTIEEPLLAKFTQPEQERLLRSLYSVKTSPLQRREVGRRLAAIGDTRSGVGLTSDGIPDIDWCSVPEGQITIDKLEPPFQVDSFLISKYLVTYSQFQSFIEHPKGFYNNVWWKNLEQPSEPGRQRWAISNYPRERVSWIDAIAFCRWLSDQLGYEVRLPTEWEWQQAFTGGRDNYVYPWGDIWLDNCAATKECGIDETFSVGMFPNGVSPVGALDLSGNLKEWCLNDYDTPSLIDLASKEAKAERGGSWASLKEAVTSTFRSGKRPDFRGNSRGFRVACSSLVDANKSNQ